MNRVWVLSSIVNVNEVIEVWEDKGNRMGVMGTLRLWGRGYVHDLDKFIRRET